MRCSQTVASCPRNHSKRDAGWALAVAVETACCTAPLDHTIFAAPQCPTRSGPIALALGYFENALGLVCPPRKDAGSFLQVRIAAGLALLGVR